MASRTSGTSGTRADCGTNTSASRTPARTPEESNSELTESHQQPPRRRSRGNPHLGTRHRRASSGQSQLRRRIARLGLGLLLVIAALATVAAGALGSLIGLVSTPSTEVAGVGFTNPFHESVNAVLLPTYDALTLAAWGAGVLFAMIFAGYVAMMVVSRW